MDMRALFCVHDKECDLEDRKDHTYNLRDGTEDCFVPHNNPVPPWLDPFHECYGCFEHACEKCNKLNRMNTECDICSNEYKQEIASVLTRYHTSNTPMTKIVETKFCPNCGRRLDI